MKSVFFLILAFILNSLANIVLKMQASRGVVVSGLVWWQALTRNWLLILGFFLFAVNAVFYFLALRNVALSTAYPIMVAMSFLIINSYALLFLGEKVNVWQVFGYFLVIIGIIMVFFFSKK